jgi:hypothetical protein
MSIYLGSGVAAYGFLVPAKFLLIYLPLLVMSWVCAYGLIRRRGWARAAVMSSAPFQAFVYLAVMLPEIFRMAPLPTWCAAFPAGMGAFWALCWLVVANRANAREFESASGSERENRPGP